MSFVKLKVKRGYSDSSTQYADEDQRGTDLRRIRANKILVPKNKSLGYCLQMGAGKQKIKAASGVATKHLVLTKHGKLWALVPSREQQHAKITVHIHQGHHDGGKGNRAVNGEASGGKGATRTRQPFILRKQHLRGSGSTKTEGAVSLRT